ncbi:MAG: dioxygenase [Rickettsiales bacterium]|nr:dioxygenase [Rickettsiales bacterium]
MILFRKYTKYFVITFLAILQICVNKQVIAITPEIVLKNIKLITPEIKEDKRYIIPQNFSHSNNLRRKTGSPFFAKGKFLYIEGFVFDLLGVPIENAVVKIWQTNNFGYYNHLVIDKEDFTKYDIDFEGTGTSITDSNGHYSFFTIIPGYYGENAPHINFIVEHEEFNRFETMMYFPMQVRNTADKKYKNLNQRNRFLITCKMQDFVSNDTNYGKKCSFDIRLNTLHNHKRY